MHAKKLKPETRTSINQTRAAVFNNRVFINHPLEAILILTLLHTHARALKCLKGDALKMSKERFFFIDNLKILLIVLVILGHLAITYGSPIGFWYYHEGQTGLIESFFYVFLLAAGQSFSMGFFFMMSGYFTPGSYDRKGAWLFLRDRLLRLGAPLLFYVIFIDPFIGYALELFKGFTGSFLDFFSLNIGSYRGLGSGPLWFVEASLMFTSAYVLWRRLAKNTNRESKIPGNKAIVVFALVLGIVTFIVRIWLPIGWNFELLNLQIPFFPQYVAMHAPTQFIYAQKPNKACCEV